MSAAMDRSTVIKQLNRDSWFGTCLVLRSISTIKQMVKGSCHRLSSGWIKCLATESLNREKEVSE